MGMLDDLIGAALGGQGLGGGAASGGSGLPAGLNAGALAALLPVVLAMLNHNSNAPAGGGPGGLGGLLGQMLGGGGGTPGGLGGLLRQFEQAGFGSHAQSWVGAGPNQPISPNAIGQVFGQDGLADIARRAGISPDEASAGLAHLLPAIVDHVTPGGQLPTGAQLDDSLAGLMKRLGG